MIGWSELSSRFRTNIHKYNFNFKMKLTDCLLHACPRGALESVEI